MSTETNRIYAQDGPVLGIDIGGTHIRLGLVSKQEIEGKDIYELSQFEIRKSQEILATGSPIENFAQLIEGYVQQKEAPIRAVSIGFPSTLDAKREVVISTPNITPLQNIAVVKELGALIKLPVFINRDVNYIFLSDIEELKGEGKLEQLPQSICGFYIGTGLGNTIMINERLLAGAHGCAAELGHIHVLDNKDKCGCGNEGCIELQTGGLALARIQREHFADTFIGDIFSKHREHKLIKQYIEHLAAAVSTEQIIIDPELSIFGGGVIQMANFPREYFEECLYRYARRPCQPQSLKFLYVKETQASGVRGAGIYAYKRLSDPSYL